MPFTAQVGWSAWADAIDRTYQESVAEECGLPNKPGALAQCLDKLAAKGVNLNSICATVSKGGKKAVVVCTGEAGAQGTTTGLGR